ncbi:hypothetical protein KC363_g209 [Hortaea werneckii]|nr:hypothetical protein KC363_g209 [Hortaea werneckii]
MTLAAYLLSENSDWIPTSERFLGSGAGELVSNREASGDKRYIERWRYYLTEPCGVGWTIFQSFVDTRIQRKAAMNNIESRWSMQSRKMATSSFVLAYKDVYRQCQLSDTL